MKLDVHHLDWSAAREQEAQLFADAATAESGAARALQARGLYTWVASVEVATTDEEYGLEEAFRLTNSIGRHWSENHEVTVAGSSRLRSTSVGDLVFIEDRCYLVEPLGFVRL